MSTHGAVGIRFNNKDKVGYNHFDSYPTGLGDSILHFLQIHSIEQLKEIYDKIELLDIFEQVDVWCWNWKNKCFNLSFCDRLDFLYDSLFCEYAYIINLDSQMLEFYKGFNKNPKANGRYAKIKSNKDVYYGVKLIQEIPLNEINDYETYEDDTETGFRKKER